MITISQNDIQTCAIFPYCSRHYFCVAPEHDGDDIMYECCTCLGLVRRFWVFCSANSWCLLNVETYFRKRVMCTKRRREIDTIAGKSLNVYYLPAHKRSENVFESSKARLPNIKCVQRKQVFVMCNRYRRVKCHISNKCIASCCCIELLIFFKFYLWVSPVVFHAIRV